MASADPIFSDPRLAAIYDDMDPDRSDLAPYLAMIEEFDARVVIDVGCGTGTFAIAAAPLADRMIAVDPAGASLAVARDQPGAEMVEWIHGTALDLGEQHADLAVMTANVAMVFLTDDDFEATLRAIARALRPRGRLVFEIRDPARRAWDEWDGLVNEQHTVAEGMVVQRTTVGLVDGEFVSFEQRFELADGTHLVSASTLRFRHRSDVERHIDIAGFDLIDVRDASDRPGREWVFVAQLR